MENIYIVEAVRSAIGSYGGSLKEVSATRLGAAVVTAALERASISPNDVGELIFGNVLQAGQGQNIARQVSLNSNIPVATPAYTINKVCGSGLKAVSLAFASIALGDAECVIAGGTENMSMAPYLLPQMRWGQRMNDSVVKDYMVNDGLWDVFNDYHMGITAENIAEKYNISRQEQDEFAACSQEKASRARKNGVFADEIVSIDIPQRKGDAIKFCEDEYIRETSVEKLGGLKPAFKKDGTVTAGNSSGINDGAACVIVASERYVRNNNLKPLAKIVGRGSVGVDPSIMGIGPVPSTEKALKNANITVQDLDLIESNEAFAAQSIAVARQLGLDLSKVNVNGGAISLGHPIGASGVRILVSLLHELTKRGGKYGLATLCIGGGMGESLVVMRDELCK